MKQWLKGYLEPVMMRINFVMLTPLAENTMRTQSHDMTIHEVQTECDNT